MFKQARLHLWWTYKELMKNKRVWFPSPAEVQFIRLMGGRVLTFDKIKLSPKGAPLSIVISMGKFLRHEYVEREWRVGPYYLDFAFITPYDHKGIEIDGARFHNDVVKEQRRDDYLKKHGWRMMHIVAADLWNAPYKTTTRVRDFLEK